MSPEVTRSHIVGMTEGSLGEQRVPMEREGWLELFIAARPGFGSGLVGKSEDVLFERFEQQRSVSVDGTDIVDALTVLAGAAVEFPPASVYDW